MPAYREVEIKFRIADIDAVTRQLKKAGFRHLTRRTLEHNTLYDLPGMVLRNRGELLRLRKYGAAWILTHKARASYGRHKSRVETETRIDDGRKLDGILRALGFVPTFVYEKFRSEWSDDHGQVVLDETPIGDFGEIEGSARWIDATAKKLGVAHADYITASYAGLFEEWKLRSSSNANNMTFKDVRSGKQRRS